MRALISATLGGPGCLGWLDPYDFPTAAVR